VTAEHAAMPDPAHADSAAYWTCDELAARWKISPALVRRMLAAGELRALRLHNRVRIPDAERARFEAAST
jgi:excisionase family DNA binding protein